MLPQKETPVLPLVHLDTLDGLDAVPVNGRTIAILPVAATEAHGPHLPASTDCDIAAGHLGALGPYLDGGIDAVVLPIQTIGASDEHGRFDETKSLPVASLIARWFGIASHFAAAGGRRLVIVSSHGGNTPTVDAVILKARAELDMLAVGTAWMRFGFPEGLYSERERKYGIHGGAIETALMLHYRPDLVKTGSIADFPSRLEALEADMLYLSGYGAHRFGWLSGDLNEKGVVGDARLADREKGAIHADHILKGFAELLGEVARFDLGWLKEGNRGR